MTMPGMSIDSLYAELHCSYVGCNDFFDDQWTIEARRLFEIRLARIKFNMLTIVRPSSAPSTEDA